MEFDAARRICQCSDLVFARPKSWEGWRRAHAIDLAGKLSISGVVNEVHALNENSIGVRAWLPIARELAEEWVLLSRGTLLREYKELKEAVKAKEQA
jgi:hypothetical protein